MNRLARLLPLPALILVTAAMDAFWAWQSLAFAGASTLGWVLGAAGLLLAAFAAVTSDLERSARLLLVAALIFTAGFCAAAIAFPRPFSALHDSVLLTDAAAGRLVHGLQPYGHDYVASPALSFVMPQMPVNYGLDHFVYLPGSLLLASPLHLLSLAGGPVLGFQFVYVPAWLALLGAAWAYGLGAAEKRAALLAIALQPGLIFDTNTQFMNDLLFIAPLVGAAAALRRGHPLATGILFAIAVLMKQQAVLLLPFLALAAWRLWTPRDRMLAAGAAAATGLAAVLPFLLWDAHAFLGDVAGFFYSSGTGNTPIRSSSLPGLLLKAGLLPNRWAGFPTWIFQLTVAVPLLALSLWWLRRRWSWPAMWLAAGAVSFLVFFFGRTLAVNYIDLSVMFAMLGLTQALAGIRHPVAEPAPQAARAQTAGRPALLESGASN